MSYTMDPLHKSPNFEHGETITYIDKGSLTRLFLSDHKSEIYYEIKGPCYSQPYQDAYSTKIVSIGKNTFITTFTPKHSDNFIHWCNIILINKDGKEIICNKYEILTDHYKITSDLDNIKNAAVNELRQMKQHINKKHLKETFTWCGDIKNINESDFAEMFCGEISPDQPVFVKGYRNEYHIELNGEKSFLKTISPVHLASTYDHFDKCIVICSKTDSGIVFERWKKYDNIWKSIGTSSHHVFIEGLKDITTVHYIHDIVCSRNHLFALTTDVDLNDIFIVFKKRISRFQEICRIEGVHPTYHDDYELWYNQGLIILQNEETLKNMSVDVLKIILLYI
jgi:hypothetical protein